MSEEAIRIRLSIKSGRDLLRREIFSPPSPFCRISIDGSGHVIQGGFKSEQKRMFLSYAMKSFN